MFLVLTLPIAYLAILLHIVWNVFKDTTKMELEVVPNAQKIVRIALMELFALNVITLFICLPLVNARCVLLLAVSHVIRPTTVLIVCNRCGSHLVLVHFALLLA